jgi:chromobox protein 1
MTRGGSEEILQEYYKSIGGRPVQKAKESTRKRGRQSTGAASSATPAKSAKKARTSIATSVVESPAGRTREAKGWNPPAGNWEDQIAHIDTIEKTENGLVAYVQW